MKQKTHIIFKRKHEDQKESKKDFRGGVTGKNLPANAGDMGSIPGPEDSTCQGAMGPMSCNYCACVPQKEKLLPREAVHHSKRADPAYLS